MGQMNRVTAGHGKTSGKNPFDWIGEKVQGRANAMHEGILSAAHQAAEHEHEIRTMVTRHVLAKEIGRAHV